MKSKNLRSGETVKKKKQKAKIIIRKFFPFHSPLVEIAVLLKQKKFETEKKLKDARFSIFSDYSKKNRGKKLLEVFIAFYNFLELKKKFKTRCMLISKMSTKTF